MNLPGFTAGVSLASGLSYYNSENPNGLGNSGDKFQVMPQLRIPNPFAVHGNCCGYSAKCRPGDAKRGDLLDQACEKHDVCVTSLFHFTLCDCHVRLIRDLETAVVHPSTSLQAKGKAWLILGAFSPLPCLCRRRVCYPTGIRWCTRRVWRRRIRYPCGTNTSCWTTRVPSTAGHCRS